MPLDSFGQVFTFYYATVAQPDAPTWQFSYQGLSGQHTYIVFLDKAGSVTEVRKADITPEGSGYCDKISWYMYESAPAQPQEGDIAREQAIDSAWQAFEAAYAPANGNRDSYKAATTLRSLDSTRFWVCCTTPKTTAPWTSTPIPTWYTPATSPSALPGAAWPYRHRLVQEALRTTNGWTGCRRWRRSAAFFTWTLEQKAELYPGTTLPGEGHLTRRKRWPSPSKTWRSSTASRTSPALTPLLLLPPRPPRWQIHMLTEAALTEQPVRLLHRAGRHHRRDSVLLQPGRNQRVIRG